MLSLFWSVIIFALFEVGVEATVCVLLLQATSVIAVMKPLKATAPTLFVKLMISITLMLQIIICKNRNNS